MKALNKWLKAGNFSKKDEHYGFLDDQDEVTAVLEFHMHCPNCANEFKKSCEKSEGVESVEIDRVKGHATVKGAFDVEKLKERLWRKAKKVVTVVSVETHGKRSTQSSHSQKK
ncbi:hypothetical protein TIFTF001_018442 [Ficus carica]|uniref:HMA domain-containing protein n=1 Tax=Ficus carica TaxID=3494 RepID=A0AA88AVI8_FICCA|nr:hypothetical protein TIFTF001_018442 [Ficus carica]